MATGEDEPKKRERDEAENRDEEPATKKNKNKDNEEEEKEQEHTGLSDEETIAKREDGDGTVSQNEPNGGYRKKKLTPKEMVQKYMREVRTVQNRQVHTESEIKMMKNREKATETRVSALEKHTFGRLVVIGGLSPTSSFKESKDRDDMMKKWVEQFGTAAQIYGIQPNMKRTLCTVEFCSQAAAVEWLSNLHKAKQANTSTCDRRIILHTGVDQYPWASKYEHHLDKIEKHVFKIARAVCENDIPGGIQNKSEMYNDWKLKELWFQKGSEPQATIMKATPVDKETNKIYIYVVTDKVKGEIVKSIEDKWDNPTAPCEFSELPFELTVVTKDMSSLQAELAEIRNWCGQEAEAKRGWKQRAALPAASSNGKGEVAGAATAAGKGKASGASTICRWCQKPKEDEVAHPGGWWCPKPNKGTKGKR